VGARTNGPNEYPKVKIERTRERSTDVVMWNSAPICDRAGETIVDDSGDMKANADMRRVA
jgi:hypothetical protein